MKGDPRATRLAESYVERCGRAIDHGEVRAVTTPQRPRRPGLVAPQKCNPAIDGMRCCGYKLIDYRGSIVRSDLRRGEPMSNRIHRGRARYAIAAMALAVPAAAFASTPPATVAKQEAPETRPAPASASRHDEAAPKKGALLRAVLDTLAEHRTGEASPFEPPGRPPDRPPNNPGHNDPPNPPGRPLDRPPETRGH